VVNLRNFNFTSVFRKADDMKIGSEKIIDLRQQLVDAGFNPGEVDYLININADGKKVSQLDTKTINQIEDALKNQLRIARKCLEFAQTSNNT